ncbi:S1/P1 nuclease [Paludisphaera rhizosphaerae]|uniref:S1/P1 nuclease n=1 Tax=Paludisphaera rhizosphaerae TaxID=2711216 RepID=UPI0013EBF734|nr:S1/P1 nuclease [Paludisphaera rhizosphaerae]
MFRIRRFIAAILVGVVSLQSAPQAFAWGRVGHRVIGRGVEARLSPKAKAAVAALLAPGETLADASVWADEHKRELPQTASWHYIDVPLDEPRYDARFSGEDPAKGCIVAKIREEIAVMKDPGRSIDERRIAFRFVVHLVQDLHMPMHVGDNSDKGGNLTQVQFFGEGSNLHRVWDFEMIERDGATEEAWLAILAKEPAAEADAAGSLEDWATESLLAARAAYQAPGTTQRMKSGAKLAEAYLEANRPVVRRRLHLATVRLARVLNEAFGG